MAMYGGDDSRKSSSTTTRPAIPLLDLDKQKPGHSSPRSISLLYPYPSATSHPHLSPRPSSWSCSSLPSLSPRSQRSPRSPSSCQRYLPQLENIIPEYWQDKSEISLLSLWGKLGSVKFKNDSFPSASSASSSPPSSSEQYDDRPDFTIKSEEECISVLSSSLKETIQHLKIDFIPTAHLLSQILENLTSLNYLYFNFYLDRKTSDSHPLTLVRHKYLTLSKQDAIDLSPEIVLQLLHSNEETLPLIRIKASEGGQAAQYILGQIYENHQIIPEEIKGENETNALLCYKQAEGNAGAQYDLGRYYLTKASAEAGTPRIKGWKEEAFRLFRLAAAQGHRKAKFHLAEDAFVREKNEDEAFKLFKSSAKQGYTKAQTYLGWMYVKKNMGKAVLWLRKAADKGHLGAQYNLGMIYKDPRIQYSGQISQEERTQEAFKWLTLAAEQNLKEAYLPLGDLYYENQGVPLEISISERMDEAWKWFQLAANQEGETEAKFKLGLMRLCEQKVESETARKWFLHEIDPLFYIWFIHRYPQGVGETPRDNDKKAIGWLQGAIQEYATPRYGKQSWQLSTMQFALGWMYMHGRVQDEKSPKEHDAAAVDLLSMAALQGLREAQFSLGKMYWEGRVADEKSPENDLIAFDLFKRAAEKDLVEALFYLGEMHWEGRVQGGLSIDNRMKALEWYNQARKKKFKGAKDKLKTILDLSI
jgi:TPR repeat protein